MYTLEQLSDEHNTNINLVLKSILELPDQKMFMQLSTRIAGISRTGFLLLERQFIYVLEMATRSCSDLSLDVEAIYSTDTKLEGNILHILPSSLYPTNYCNLNCGNEKVNISDFLKFKWGGQENGPRDDKEKAEVLKLKSKVIRVYSGLLFVDDPNKLKEKIASKLSKNLQLPLGLTLDNVMKCLDKEHEHYNIGIAASLLSWATNNREGKLEDSEAERMTELETLEKHLIESKHMTDPFKSSTKKAIVSLSGSGNVKPGPKSKKV